MEIRIGELAKRTRCEIVTIRYYEKEGLLPKPARSGGNFRLYGDAHVERLQFIRHCRSLDMTLDEIRTLLNFRDTPEENCAGVNTLLDKHIGHVADRIRELQALESQLQELRSRCLTVQSTQACGILQGLANGDDIDPRNLGSHSGGCH